MYFLSEFEYLAVCHILYMNLKHNYIMKTSAFRDVTPFNLTDLYRRSRTNSFVHRRRTCF